MVSGDLTFESSELVVDGCMDNLQRKTRVCIRQVTGTNRAQRVVKGTHHLVTTDWASSTLQVSIWIGVLCV